MEALPFQTLALAIQDHLDMVASAKLGLANTVAQVQETCDHRMVFEKPYESPNWNATRICAHCRLMEEGSHWSGGNVWSVKDHKTEPVLGNVAGRIVQPISRERLWSLRVAV